MNKYLSLLFGLPRTIWFNLRYLPLNIAIKFPIILASNVRVKNCYRGGVVLKRDKISLGMIKIGFHSVDNIDTSILHSIIDIRLNSSLIFEGDAHIGIGAIICCKGGTLKIGNNFAISGTTSILCYDSINIGDNVQLSWNTLIMDCDAHKIYLVGDKLLENHAPINIGDRVWVASSTTILKGSTIPNNCVIGSNSLLNQKYYNEGYIIAGIPGKEIKAIERWEI